MANLLLYYGTSEGQTGKIAQVLTDDLRREGHRVNLLCGPRPVHLEDYDAILIGDSVYVGRFHRHVRRFVQRHRTELSAKPSAFFSVCLSVASKNVADREAGRNIGRTFLARSEWTPLLYDTFAGALMYSRYGRLKRWLLQRIARRSGYQTTTDRDYEYTDWDQVHRFAQDFLVLMNQRLRTAASAQP